MLSTLLFLLAATPTFAKTDLEKAAALDAEQVLQEAEKSASQLLEKDLESPTEFGSARRSIENPLKEYCDSMRIYPRIFNKCDSLKKSITAPLDKQEEAIKKNGKPDKLGEIADKLEEFHFRRDNLRGVQENGKNLEPDVLKREREALLKEMRAYCPEVPDPQLEKRCLASAKQIENSLLDHEESIRKGAYEYRPPSKKIYKNTTPMLRCIPSLPKIRNSDMEYKISDEAGRYRYEHLTKSKYGYALNVKLSEFTKRSVNRSKIVNKKFSDPRNEKTYSFRVSTQFGCSMGGPENCRADALVLTLEHMDGPQTLNRAYAAFPIKLDSVFDLTLPMDDDHLEEFTLNCMIASKVRKGGWIYSDEGFEE